MRKEQKVGLTLLLAILLVYLTIAWAGRFHWFAPDEQNWELSFDNVNGLLIGDPVVVRGYPSGRVVQINPQAKSVSVEIALDKNIRLYEGARGEIQIKELMGGKQLSLSPGAGVVPLPNGRIIPGKASLDFSTSFSRFGQMFDLVNPDQLTQLLVGFDSLGKNLRALIHSLEADKVAQMVAGASSSMARVDRMLAKAEQANLVGQFDGRLQQSEKLFAQTDSLMSLLLTTGRRLEAESLPEAENLLQQAGKSLEGLDRSLVKVDLLLSSFQNDEAMVGRMLNDPAFVQKVDSVLDNLNQVLEQIHSEKIIVGFKRKKAGK
ncbi:MAG: MlaD family protein [Bacteroidota bacterium]